MKLRNTLLTLAMVLTAASGARADAINGTLFYTTFAGGQNVWKVDFNYDGGNNPLTSFSFSNDQNIASVGGADGIVFDPNTGNLLIGGQGAAVHMVTPGGALVSTVNPGANVLAYHLSVDPTGDTVWASTCCGGNVHLGEVPLGPLAAGTGHDVTGDVTFVDTLAWVPTGDVSNPYTTWYTSSDANGGECIGVINMTTFATTNKVCNLPASHGMVFDPLSQTLILMGDDHISQYNPFSESLVGDIDVGVLACQGFGFCGNLQFDQGTVDGEGHIFAATNNGVVFFVDYSSALGYDIDLNSFIGAAFLRANLDDLAPLVGPGSDVPEPMTLSLVGLGAVGLARRQWKRGRFVRSVT